MKFFEKDLEKFIYFLFDKYLGVVRIAASIFFIISNLLILHFWGDHIRNNFSIIPTPYFIITSLIIVNMMTIVSLISYNKINKKSVNFLYIQSYIIIGILMATLLIMYGYRPKFLKDISTGTYIYIQYSILGLFLIPVWVGHYLNIKIKNNKSVLKTTLR